jgi:putative two-component system response regulator
VQSKKIMVIDDQPANLKLMETMLRPFGHSIRSFPRGRLALIAAAQDPPDLILLDINMPEMNGFEVCRQFKSDGALSSIPVIFLSALDQTEDKVMAFRSGGIDYITKPFQPEEMYARIETQLKVRDLHDTVERQNRDLRELVEEQVREIAAAQMAAIFALAKLAESRDSDTGKHLERVQMLCGILAAEARADAKYSATITDDFARNLFHASPLHDIGKVAIPDSILLKPGKLTAEERIIMETHTTRGAETLEMVLLQHPANAFIRMGIEIARAHHEWWNGKGYPGGLVAEDIPLAARIMAVADCYDALRSGRCYKQAYLHEEARDVIRRGSGSQFDPDMVRLFLNVEDAYRRVSDEVN